jgi:hypothetical protein
MLAPFQLGMKEIMEWEGGLVLGTIPAQILRYVI